VSAASEGAALLLADSEATRRDIMHLLRVSPQRVRVIPLAADERYRPTPTPEDATARARYALPEHYVLYLGGFDARKNGSTLLAAWALAAPALGPQFTLIIGGRLPSPDGRLFTDWPRQAAESGLSQSVRFIGPVAEADKPALYRGAAAFVYPSRYEGFGLPPLEAMACGTPVIAGNGGALPEVIGDAGYALPPDDVRALAAAIIACCQDKHLATQLRARGPAQAQKFSWEYTARATAAAYSTVNV